MHKNLIFLSIKKYCCLIARQLYGYILPQQNEPYSKIILSPYDSHFLLILRHSEKKILVTMIFYERLNVHQLFITQISSTDKTSQLMLFILWLFNLFILLITTFLWNEMLCQVCYGCGMQINSLRSSSSQLKYDPELAKTPA